VSCCRISAHASRDVALAGKLLGWELEGVCRRQEVTPSVQFQDTRGEVQQFEWNWKNERTKQRKMEGAGGGKGQYEHFRL
jgi:hypothetical protein